MAKTATVLSKIDGFSEAATALSTKVISTFSHLEELQHKWMVVTRGEDAITTGSFFPQPGTPERRLLNALALRRAEADLMDQYGLLILTLIRGDSEELLAKHRLKFEASAEKLHDLHSKDDASVQAADSDLMASAQTDTAPTPLSPREQKLEEVGKTTVGVMGVVAKVAATSPVGIFSKVVVIATGRISWRIRLKKGKKALEALTPGADKDIRLLAKVLVDSRDPLSEATDELIQGVLDWHNAHCPGVDDPARIPAEMEIASMVRVARNIKTALVELADAYGKLSPAHQEFMKMLTASGKDGGASDQLVKTVSHGARG